MSYGALETEICLFAELFQSCVTDEVGLYYRNQGGAFLRETRGVGWAKHDKYSYGQNVQFVSGVCSGTSNYQ